VKKPRQKRANWPAGWRPRYVAWSAPTLFGIIIWSHDGRITDANEAFLRIVGYNRADLLAGRVSWMELTPPEWHGADAQRLAMLKATGIATPYEKEYVHKNGHRVPVLVGGAAFDEAGENGAAFVVDLTDRKNAEQAARESESRYAEVQTELEHANRVATMGQLSASITHEVKQPMTAAITNAEAALEWLETQQSGWRLSLHCSTHPTVAHVALALTLIRRSPADDPRTPEPIDDPRTRVHERVSRNDTS